MTSQQQEEAAYLIECHAERAREDREGRRRVDAALEAAMTKEI